MSSRIIPAYAGSTSAGCPPTPAPADHPRIRGEHSSSHTFVPHSVDHPRIRGEHASTHSSVCGSCGSSPHTRGALQFYGTQKGDVRIIPAYAGSTGQGVRVCAGARDHPRIRGEHRPRRRLHGP